MKDNLLHGHPPRNRNLSCRVVQSLGDQARVRKEREAALEGGHFHALDSIVRIQHEVLFEAPEVAEMERQNRLGKVRDELRDIAESAKFSGDGEIL